MLRIVRHLKRRFWSSRGDPPELWTWRRELGPLSVGSRAGEQFVVHFDAPVVGAGLVVDFRICGVRGWVETDVELRPTIGGAFGDVHRVAVGGSLTTDHGDLVVSWGRCGR